MTDTRPLIGVVDQGTPKVAQYVALVEAAGGRAEIIDWRQPRDADADAAHFDGIVLCGGDDPPGRYFGEEDHPAITLDDPRRDEYELALCRAIMERSVPLLGICRGAQMLNIALGGTIDQHLPDVPGSGEHAGGVEHALRVEPGSFLADAQASEGAGVGVNSYHHQAVARVAAGLRATAWSDDGVIEAIEALPGHGAFCLGVQWHPERAGNTGPFGTVIFDRFVASARGAGGPAIQNFA